ncbi:hypothetical protein Emag_003758 [Eimeria magna]
MNSLGLARFWLLAAYLTITEQHFLYLAFAATGPLDGLSAGLFEGEVVDFDQSHAAGFNQNLETLPVLAAPMHDLVYPPTLTGPHEGTLFTEAESLVENEAASAGGVETPSLFERYESGLNRVNSGSLSTAAVKQQDLASLPKYGRPSEENPPAALGFELPVGNGEMSAYQLQVEKERQAKNRMASAGLILGVVATIFYFTVLLGADVLIKNIHEQPGIRLVDAIPQGMGGNLIRLGGFIAAFGPMLSLYLMICFFRWLRHYRILKRLKRSEVEARGKKGSVLQTSGLGLTAAASSPGFNSQ